MAHFGPTPQAVITTTTAPNGQRITQVQTNGPVTPAAAAVISQVVAAQTGAPALAIPSAPVRVPVAVAALAPTPLPIIHGGPGAAHHIRRVHQAPNPTGLHNAGIKKAKHVQHTRVLLGNPHPAPVLPAQAIHQANQPALRQIRTPHAPTPSSSVTVKRVIKK